MPKILFPLLFLFPSLAFAFETSGDSIKYVFDEVSVIGKGDRKDFKKIPSSTEKIIIGEDDRLEKTISGVPGIVLQQRGPEVLTKITMRGFGQRSNDPQITGIKILVDGFPETEPDGRTPLDLLDLSSYGQIEIGKTNSFNLFSPASGGYLNFITDRKVSGSFSGSRFTFGSFGYQKLQVEAGGKLKNGAAFLNVSNTKYLGWRNHSKDFATNFNFYLKNQLDDFSNLNLSIAGVSSSYQLAGPLTSAQLASDPSQANQKFLAQNERRSNKIIRFGATYQKYFSDEQSLSASVFISPRILMRSQKNSYRDFNRIHLGGRVQYNLTKNFSSETENNFSLGIDNQYQTGPSIFYSLNALQGRGTTLKQNKNEGGLNYGMYLHDELNYRQLTVDVSLRFSQMQFLLDDFIDPSLSDKLIFSAVTPGIGVSFPIDKNNFVMLHYVKGVESPGFNEVDPPADIAALRGLNPLLKPSISHTVEGGVRGNFSFAAPFIRSLEYSAVMYTLLTYDELVPYQVSDASYFVPAGKTKRYGVEATFSLATENYLHFEGAINVAKNYFVDFKNTTDNFSKKTIPGVPGSDLFFSLGYQNPSFPFVTIQYANVGKVYVDNGNAVSAESFDKINLQLSYQVIFKAVTINGFVSIENLFDKKYISSVFVNGSNGEFFEPGLPRNITGSVALNYQF